MLVIVGTLDMIKKKTDKHINKIPGSSSLYEIQQIPLCRTAQESTVSVIRKISPERGSKKHKYIECI